MCYSNTHKTVLSPLKQHLVATFSCENINADSLAIAPFYFSNRLFLINNFLLQKKGGKEEEKKNLEITGP